MNRDAHSTTTDDHARNPYPGWAADEVYADDIRAGGLLDLAAAREVFGRDDAARGDVSYPLAVPLHGTSGATADYLGRPHATFSTYGYLGLNGHPHITEAAVAAVQSHGTSTGGVRMLTGTTDLHIEAEERLAAWTGRESAALFCTGYDANLAAISSLFGPGDVAVVDKLAHRSLVDGCRLAGVTTMRFRHNDLAHLDEVLGAAVHRARGHRVLVVVDGVYSMDGDVADLAGLVELKRRHGAFLLVDESHALGVLGPEGRGTAHAQGVDPEAIDLTTASLGKAIPSVGGLVAGSRSLTAYLRHGSAPFIFSSAVSPANAAAITASIDVVESEPEHLRRLWENTARLTDLVESLGFEHPSTTPIVPLILADPRRALGWARHGLDHSVYLSPVFAPAVPASESRLRLCATGGHTPEHFALLERALRSCLQVESDAGSPDRVDWAAEAHRGADALVPARREPAGRAQGADDERHDDRVIDLRPYSTVVPRHAAG